MIMTHSHQGATWINHYLDNLTYFYYYKHKNETYRDPRTEKIEFVGTKNLGLWDTSTSEAWTRKNKFAS